MQSILSERLDRSKVASNLSAKCDLFYQTEDSAEQKKLIQEIFNPKLDFGFLNNGPAVCEYENKKTELAKRIIDNKSFERIAVHYLYLEEREWLIEHYKKQNRTNALETLILAIFDASIDRLLNGKNGDWKEEELFSKDELSVSFFETEVDNFHFIKRAADKGYAEAYRPLAKAYENGIGCQENMENAFQYWKLAAQNGCSDCYIPVGDCYRLGKGTEKDFDKAWDAYEKAEQAREKRYDEITTKQLLLDIEQPFQIYPFQIYTELIGIDWIEYAIKKQTKPIPAMLYAEIATNYFQCESEEYYHWIKLGAKAGDIGAKCIVFDITEDPAEKNKLIQVIFNSKLGDDVIDNVKDLAKKLIDDKDYEELAVRFLFYHGELDWLDAHYKEQNRSDDLGNILQRYRRRRV